MTFKIFDNKISTFAMFTLLFIYIVLITRSVLLSFLPTTPPLQPYTFHSVQLVERVLAPGKPLVEQIDGTVNIHGCNTYILRTIINSDTRQEVWISVHGPEPAGTLEDHIEKDKTIVITIPILSAGNYIYRAEVHAICDKKSYIVLLPLQTFTISTQKSLQ